MNGRNATLLGLFGVALIALGEWLRREPACKWANATGGEL